MNPFAFACITPHGTEIIPELSQPHLSLMQTTRLHMQQLGQWMHQARPDTIVVLTPHGVRIDGQFCVADSERMLGVVLDHGGRVAMERSVDRDLARYITANAKEAGLAIGAANFATSAGPLSCLPLDWGAIVPLYFMPDVPIVVITPSRSVSYEDHLHLGKIIADTAASSNKRIGLVASCDWSHAHDENGPYGYHPAAKELDEQVVNLLKANDFDGLMGFAPDFIENAKPDGIWQALILAGALKDSTWRSEFLSYEVPTYFGLMCVAYHMDDGVGSFVL